MNEEQKMQINSALNNSGIQFALPQTVQPVWKTQRQVSSVQYDPNKLKALLEALKVKRPQMSRGEIIGNALANMPEARSFTGGFGEEIINPWAAGLTNFARGFGSAYAAKKQAERERLEQEREDAIKAAQLENEANKQAITEEIAKDYIKFNDPNGKTFQQLQQEETQKQAVLNALHELDDLAKNGGITSLNKSTENWMLSGDSSKNIGRREQALSTLVPLTAKVAHDAGISGINSVGEAMLYLGIPTNATSKQIEGMLPGIIKKLGLEEEFYQRSPINNGMAF
jgi:hypothetical protein